MSLISDLLRIFGLQRIPSIPQYVQDVVVYPPPYSCVGVQMYGFIVEGDKTRINNYLDKRLNLPGNDTVRYEVVSPYIMLTFTYMPKVLAGGEFKNDGWLTETEVTAWVLTIGKKNIGGVWIPDPLQLRFMAVYIWVDNPISIAGGREIYGFPKQWGATTMPTTLDPQSVPVIPSMTLDVLGLKTFDPNTGAKVQRLMEMVGTPDSGATGALPPTVWTDISGALISIYDKLSSHRQTLNLITPPRSLLDHLFDVGVPLVFFKQFRGVSNDKDACFQAVSDVNVEVNLTTFQGGLLPGAYQLTIEDIASQPLAADLGLQSQPSLVHFWLEMDMTFGFGTNVYSTYSNQ